MHCCSQEKNKLIKDIKQLKAHYEKYEPAIKVMRKKYETLMREKMLVSIDRDNLRKRLQDGSAGVATKGKDQIKAVRRGQEEELTSPGKHSKSPARVASKAVVSNSSPAAAGAVRSSSAAAGAALPVGPQKNPFEGREFEPVTGRSFRAEKTFKGHKMGLSQIALHPRKPVVVRTLSSFEPSELKLHTT
jgi:sperm-associated antigen 16 protein